MFPNPEIFGIYFQWYSFWQSAAIIATILFGIFYLCFKKNVQIKWSSFAMLFVVAIFFGYFGAKTLSFIDYTTQSINEDFSFNNLYQGNLRWYGALLMIVLFVPIFGKIIKVNVHNYLDFLVLKLCLFTAIVKQACFFSGDGCYGIFTNSVFGMYFHYGAAPSILPVHPTPLYDSVFHLLFFVFLYRWNDIKKYDGQTAIFFFVGTSLFNIALECIRRNTDIVFGLTLSQLTYILILIITTVYYLRIRQPKQMPKLSQA